MGIRQDGYIAALIALVFSLNDDDFLGNKEA
ncbi:hypothetical protein LMG28727_07516 [Paraburkholderia kirstenboschensis]|nr:hypothetical protein LMG28727_07516 [Paraburkholderia kirstenboschensis]